MITDNYQKLMKHVQELNPQVKVVIASKTQSIETIQKLVNLGHHCFGENRLQEAKEKWEAFPNVEWHFIGHLQSKKAKDVVTHCELIHSVDRESLLEAINKEAAKIDKVQQVLLQVNTSGEDNKSGVNPEEVENFLVKFQDYKNIKVIGLMTMAHQVNTAELAIKSFQLLSEIKSALNRQGFNDIKELSMGMSSDYELAIKNGSTMIRPGRIIFGDRE